MKKALVVALLSLSACKIDLGKMAQVDAGGVPLPDLMTTADMTSTIDLDVEPSDMQTITVTAGGTTPSVAYMATLLGTPILVRWSVDRGDIGTIDTGSVSSATFAPRGTTGGLVTVIASIDGTTVKRQVMVKLTTTPQNGYNSAITTEMVQIPASVAAIKAGGGVGGVGGEGLGGAVSDTNTMTALGSPTATGSAQNLAFLYPYDKTVWPRGMSAPLLMWNWTTGDADAIKIDLSTTSGSFTWSGTFGRPSILTSTGGNFIRHPIPQDVWDMATNSSGGLTPDGKQDKLTVKLTIAKAGQAYGPISETWGIARARLTGSVYYNTYGTQQVINFDTPSPSPNIPAGTKFGAAIMGIHLGDAAPKVVVGTPSSDNSGCRVCHTVASKGRWLITQSGTDYYQSYAYDLTSPNVPASAVNMSPSGTFAWAGMLSDGSYALAGTISPINIAPSLTTNTSSFWEFGSQIQQVANYGLPLTLSAGYPAFSPDDKYVSYIDMTNPSTPELTVASYDKSSQMFGTPQAIYAAPMGKKVGFPAFLPDNSGVIFATEVRAGNGMTVMTTVQGARSELWWIKSGNTAAVPLEAVNGKSAGTSYLPIAANNHGIVTAGDPGDSLSESGYDDTTLNYEGTVAPVLTGGYAWMVFTSRRMYGNMLTTFPWKSDGRDYDITDLSLATTKKVWVAAVSLGADATDDPSYPAFYLPAQELLAGNSRAFWALDPCQGDGNSCDSGDQCCGGCCQPNGNGGALICDTPGADGHCSAVAGCSGVQEKCVTTADCCDGTNKCVNGFCAQVIN